MTQGPNSHKDQTLDTFAWNDTKVNQGFTHRSRLHSPISPSLTDLAFANDVVAVLQRLHPHLRLRVGIDEQRPAVLPVVTAHAHDERVVQTVHVGGELTHLPVTQLFKRAQHILTIIIRRSVFVWCSD